MLPLATGPLAGRSTKHLGTESAVATRACTPDQGWRPTPKTRPGCPGAGPRFNDQMLRGLWSLTRPLGSQWLCRRAVSLPAGMRALCSAGFRVDRRVQASGCDHLWAACSLLAPCVGFWLVGAVRAEAGFNNPAASSRPPSAGPELRLAAPSPVQPKPLRRERPHPEAGLHQHDAFALRRFRLHSCLVWVLSAHAGWGRGSATVPPQAEERLARPAPQA